MIRRSPELARLSPLWAGADSGVFDLPAEIAQTRATLHRLEADALLRVPDPKTAHIAVIESMIDAAKHDRALPDAAKLLATKTAHSADVERVRLVEQAAETVANELLSLVLSSEPGITARFLRPVFEKVLADARGAVATFAEHGMTASDLLRAPQKARDSWLSLDDLAERYQLLRAAHAALRTAGARPRLDDGEFSEFLNLREFYPQGKMVGAGSAKPPWPTGDRRAFLVWLVTSSARPWMPTVDDQDAAYDEKYGQAQREHREAGALVRAGF